mgnify:CR=1 FL=1
MDSVLSPLPPTLRESVEKWVAYKGERREEYKPVGLQSLVTQITKAAEEYGEEAMIDVISRSMAANYKGIVFDWLKMRPISKGAAKMQHGVQRHGDELDAYQLAAIGKMLNEEDEL